MKRLHTSLAVLMILLAASAAGAMFFFITASYIYFSSCVALLLYVLVEVFKHNRRNAEKITFLLDAVENDDYSFSYSSHLASSNDSSINNSLNRIKDLLLKAKADIVAQEKYYEIILNSVNTGIVVVNDRGAVYQRNNEALRILGLEVFTHINQLQNVEETLPEQIKKITPGNKTQISYHHERGKSTLSVHVSEVTIRNEKLKLLAINDINSELDENEIDSWVRLFKVLTHEIMNAITPISSISETLLSRHENMNVDLVQGLEIIHNTSQSLTSFVDSYRKLTRIPTPQPSLFYVSPFISRMVELMKHQKERSNIEYLIHIDTPDLLLYADENLISQVVLNLLKNATEAIDKQTSGIIEINAFSNAQEEVILEISNNGTPIVPEIAEQLFIPFFTTKEQGSGIGLPISRQIMRLSKGSLTLNTRNPKGYTSFILRFN